MRNPLSRLRILRSPWLLAASGGAIFALTSPPTDLYPAVIVGLALLAASLDEPTPSFARAFGRGVVWGTSAGLIGLRFVPPVIQRFTDLGVAASILALVLLSAAQSLIWAVGAGVTALLRRHARVPFVFAFGGGVLVTLSLPSIFLWSPAGLVSPWPAFVQLADVIGERGVSVIFAMAAAGLAVAFRVAREDRRRAARMAIAALLPFAVLPIQGALRIASIRRASATLPVLRVGLVDQAVPPRERWDPANAPAILQTLRSLTTRAEAEGAELTVWPEAAYPFAVRHEDRRAPVGRRGILGKDVHGPLLVGLITLAAPERLPSGDYEQNSFNSAALVLPDGSLAPPSDKMQLLWFGEMVPLGAELPWLRRMFQRSGGLIPGDAPRAQELVTPAVKMAILNCYEDTLPDLGRSLSGALAPELLVNVTNDAWFYGTAEPELHARLSAMRAIELRVDLVRAVNLGVSSWIDAAGVVRARRSGTTPDMMLVTPALRAASSTLYARWGDAPVFTIFVLLGAACLYRARRPKPVV